VHAADWPTPGGHRDDALAAQVDAVRRLVALGRAARTDGKVKTRQPLRRALLLHPGIVLDEASRTELETELNVKVADTIEGLGGIVSWTAVPNFRTLGPRLGPKVNEVKAALASIDGATLRQALDEHGWVEVAGQRLEADDLEIRAERHGQFALAQEGPWAVALDLELDDGLLVEGTARELSRAINDLRKERGFAIADRVRVVVQAGDGGRVRAALDAHGAWIAGEVLADAITTGDVSSDPFELDGEHVAIDLTRV
jgi:isoleucyl-tRNA synthetase